MNEQMHAENPGTNCTSCGTSWYITYAKVPQQICCGRLGIQLHEQGPNPATLSPQTECSAQSKICNTLDGCCTHDQEWPCGDSAGTVSWTALATIVKTPSMAVAMVVLGSLGTACSDVVVDSIVVERSRGEAQVCTSIHLLL